MDKKRRYQPNANKKRIIKSFEKLSPELQDRLKESYPYGYSNQLIRLNNAKNETFFAVPLETDDTMYMVKVHIDKVKRQKNADDEFHFSLGEEGDDYTVSEEADFEPDDPSYDNNYDDDKDD